MNLLTIEDLFVVANDLADRFSKIEELPEEYLSVVVDDAVKKLKTAEALVFVALEHSNYNLEVLGEVLPLIHVLQVLGLEMNSPGTDWQGIEEIGELGALCATIRKKIKKMATEVADDN